MKISEIALPRFKSKDEQFKMGEVKLWFTNYFKARNKAKEVLGIEASPIQMPYSQPKEVSWDNQFYPKPFLDELKPLLENISVVPAFLENDKNIKEIASLAKNLADALEVYRHIRIVSNESITEFFRRKKTPKPVPIEPYPSDEMLGATTRNLDPAQQALSDRLWATREEPRFMRGVRPELKFPQEIIPKWKEVEDWRKVKRDYHNQISLDLKNFVYPRNLIKLISKSEMIIKI